MNSPSDYHVKGARSSSTTVWTTSGRAWTYSAYRWWSAATARWIATTTRTSIIAVSRDDDDDSSYPDAYLSFSLLYARGGVARTIIHNNKQTEKGKLNFWWIERGQRKMRFIYRPEVLVVVLFFILLLYGGIGLQERFFSVLMVFGLLNYERVMGWNISRWGMRAFCFSFLGSRGEPSYCPNSYMAIENFNDKADVYFFLFVLIEDDVNFIYCN